jgi:PITH domain
MLTKPHDQFNQAVRVRSIILHTNESQKGPKLIKLLVNRNAIDFEDVEDAAEPEAAQVLEVPEDAIKEGRPIDLRFVRFQSVNSLHVSTACGSRLLAYESRWSHHSQIFVSSNHGGEETTRLDAIDILGFPSG